MEDPNEAERPDYTTEEHQAARQQLVDEGLTEDIRENLLHEFKVIPRNFRKFQGIPLK
jgi:hypothetical protein